MTIRVYRWDDASAPTLNGTVGSLIALLDAVLVNGYGSQSAAGWTKSYSGTNLAAYRMGAGTQMYLHVNDTTTSTAVVAGYETMSDINTGTGKFPAAVTLYFMKSSTTDSTARPWLIAADNKRFYMYVGHNDTTATGLASSAYKPGYWFGDFKSYLPNDAYNCALIANSTTAVSGSNMATLSTSAAAPGHYTASAYDQTTAAPQFAKYIASMFAAGSTAGALSSTQGTTYPDVVTGGMLLSKMYIKEHPSNAVLRGELPGIWCPLHNLPGNPGDTFSGAAGTPLAGKSFVLLDSTNTTTRGRIALETSDTWDL